MESTLWRNVFHIFAVLSFLSFLQRRRKKVLLPNVTNSFFLSLCNETFFFSPTLRRPQLLVSQRPKRRRKVTRAEAKLWMMILNIQSADSEERKEEFYWMSGGGRPLIKTLDSLFLASTVKKSSQFFFSKRGREKKVCTSCGVRACFSSLLHNPFVSPNKRDPLLTFCVLANLVRN